MYERTILFQALTRISMSCVMVWRRFFVVDTLPLQFVTGLACAAAVGYSTYVLTSHSEIVINKAFVPNAS